jgi:hypothetical protein
MKNRFEARPDPSYRFEIWDNENSEPVIHHDRLLSFETARRAARIARFLNDAAAAAWTDAPTEIEAANGDAQAGTDVDKSNSGFERDLP